MAIFRPEVKRNNETNKFLGICEFGIIDFKDRTNEFDWADLYIDIEIKQKFSEYTRNLQIKGSFDMESTKITGGSVLKRLYHFFDVIGCTAGLNTDGGWEDEKGDKIEDIQKYLRTNFIKAGNTETYEPPFDYIAYIYKFNCNIFISWSNSTVCNWHRTSKLMSIPYYI